MTGFLLVGLGGALGSMARYGVALVNVAGNVCLGLAAVVIGRAVAAG